MSAHEEWQRARSRLFGIGASLATVVDTYLRYPDSGTDVLVRSLGCYRDAEAAHEAAFKALMGESTKGGAR